MLLKIFKFEIKYWFNNPLFYVYFGVLFAVSTLFMGMVSGMLDGVTATQSSSAYQNSAVSLIGFINEFTVLGFFLLPSIIGGTINKDFSSNTSNMLYSYPFTKLHYLLGKYLSGLVITIIVLSAVMFGAMVGGYLPGTNPELLGEFRLLNYLQPFVLYVIPNLIFVGGIVFAVVTFSRNIASGFVAVLVLLLVQGIAQTVLGNIDSKEIGTFLDPFGAAANTYYTQYWTPTEQNENLLPFEGYVIFNRLLWGGLGLLIFFGVLKGFSFTHSPFTFNFKKKKGERIINTNFGSMIKIKLPKISFDYGFVSNFKAALRLSFIDFKYVITGWPFIIIIAIGLLFLIAVISVTGQLFGTSLQPVTWLMLNFGAGTFSLLALVPVTFLYAGLLMHRSRIEKIDQLVDITPTPNWVFLVSKLFALIKIQVIMLLMVMVAGMAIQSYNGYYSFEIDVYMMDLLGVRIWGLIAWALLAVFIQTIIPNYLAGFFVSLALGIGITYLDSIGIEQDLFKYNEGPNASYSDMVGYGRLLSRFFLYKFYWLLLGGALFVLSIAFWKRGMPTVFKNRLRDGLSSFSLLQKLVFAVFIGGFLSIGSWIYYTNNIKNEYVSSKEREQNLVEWEKHYKKYDEIDQPRIIDVNVTLDLVPESRDFKAKGVFVLKNKSNSIIDSIHLNHNNLPSKFSFDQPAKLVLEDKKFNYDIYYLTKPLNPGDSITLSVEVWNDPNTLLRSSNLVRKNGTFLNGGSIFPGIGYSSNGELSDNKIRKKYGLPEKERMKSALDSANLKNTYISSDADWVNFETIVSTSKDQIAIAPGYLQKEWTENGRRYFHYKMDRKMLNFYAFQSAKYEVFKDKWNDVNIEFYYHKGHDFNIDRMNKGVKKSLAYYSENYSPYQHKQLRIIEFPASGRIAAQAFANTIPFSETGGFLAKVDDGNESNVDYPFTVTAHEVAHQWWAHQVIGANVQGVTLLSESLSEYSCLKVLEKEYGSSQMRTFLKDALDKYLLGRATESSKEKALIYNENQQYIHYRKGSLILYALSDYIGEKKMNNAIKAFLEKNAFQEAPYTTSLDFLSYMKEATPDSLQYLINDMFETITLYDNSVKETSYKKLDNGKYEVTISALTSKYKADEKGKKVYKNAAGDSLAFKIEGKRKPMQSLPLADWIDVGVFAKKEVNGVNKEVPLYLEKHRFDAIDNEIKIVVDEKPDIVGIDPYNKLIDTNSNDNRRNPDEKTD